MSVSNLPSTVNIKQLAQANACLQTPVMSHDWSRLLAAGAKVLAVTDVELQFCRNASGREQIDGQVNVSLELVCQRCLKPLQQQMSLNLKLERVKNSAAAEQLISSEPLLLTGDELIIADLIEDEILLHLPLVPRHEDDSCETKLKVDYELTAEETNNINPFAVLKELY